MYIQKQGKRKVNLKDLYLHYKQLTFWFLPPFAFVSI